VRSLPCVIDTTFDLRSDAGDKDPDSHSATLREYHRILWSKPLPSGELFTLSDTTPGSYLHHRSGLGEFHLASDSMIPTFHYWEQAQPMVQEVGPERVAAFCDLSYTIAGMIVFPGNKIGTQMTLNGAKGFHPRISDRMDLTLECVRRHYLGLDSPLGAAIARYSDFFALFGDFDGYVDFFLMHDMVDSSGQVRFALPFDDFSMPSAPKDAPSYERYMATTIEFLTARNDRIATLHV